MYAYCLNTYVNSIKVFMQENNNFKDNWHDFNKIRDTVLSDFFYNRIVLLTYLHINNIQRATYSAPVDI